MITGKTIEEVSSEIGKDWTTCIQSNLQTFLNRNEFKTRLTSGEKMTFNEVPNNSIIRVCYPSSNAHFVVKSNNKIYDPLVGIIAEMLAYVKITHYLTFEKMSE